MPSARRDTIPVIDLFAGPGGLGEGFAALPAGPAPGGRPAVARGPAARAFRIALSIETDPVAHRTLLLRAFFRQFPPPASPPAPTTTTSNGAPARAMTPSSPPAPARPPRNVQRPCFEGLGHSFTFVIKRDV